MSAPQIEFLRVRTLSEIVEVTIETLRSNARPLLSGIVRYAGPWILIATALTCVEAVQLLKVDVNGLLTGESRSTRALSTIANVFTVIAFASTQAMLVSFLLFISKHGRGPSAQELHDTMRGEIGGAMKTNILAGLVIIAGLLLFVVPGVYIAIPLTLVYVVRRFEGTAFGAALKRARALTNQHWWWTFGVVLVVGLIQIAVILVASLPAIAISTLDVLSQTDGDVRDPSLVMVIATVLFTAVSTLVSSVAVLLPLTSHVFLYFSHRERTEGSSLLERAEQIMPESDAQ